MKNCILILILLVFASFNREINKTEKFILKGNIKGYGNGQVIISYSDPNVLITPDTVEVIEDKFVLTGSLTSPRYAFLKIMKNDKLTQEYFRIDFILENSEIVLTASVDNIKEYKLEGSKNQLVYKTISQQGNDLRLAFKESRDLYMKAPQGSVEKLELENEMIKKREEYLSFLLSIENFSSSHAVAYALWLFSDKVPWERLKELLPMFNESLKENVYLKYMIRKVEGADRNKPGSVAANFNVKNLEGKSFTLEDYKGNYLLIFFSASWCVPCKYEYPFLIQAYEKYNDAGLKMITLNLDDEYEKWKGDVTKENFPWPVLSDLTAFTGDLTKNYGIMSIPKVFLIDPQGKIISNSLRGENILRALEEIYKK